MPRLVVPGYPHHVTQRGNRRMKTFFCDDDYRAYLQLLADGKMHAEVSVWAYCLMPNHVHIVAVPEREDGLSRLFRYVHRHYSRRINFRENWKGHLWQERFHSFVMDERYLHATVRYTELNPVKAGLCRRPEDWPWSSARAHLVGCDDVVTTVRPMLERIGDWSRYLSGETSNEEVADIRRSSSTGRPAGNGAFMEKLEALTGRDLKRKKPGRKPAIE
jgi:putative transposase